MTVYLVDTSAWILSFSASPPHQLQTLLEEALDSDSVQTCGIVLAELLQGCRGEAAKRDLETRFASLHYLNWEESGWITLGETSAFLRSKGLTVPIMDVMIALLALRHRSTVLHRDRHFDHIAKHCPLLVEKV